MERITCQKSIAEELNLSQSTVSLALRNKPGVNKETVAKVHAAAARLGYVPDPMLSSLAEYRSRNRPSTFRAVIPWLHTDRKLSAHRSDLPWGKLLSGARERSEKRGYKLETFLVGTDEQKPDSFLRTLGARGIPGVICGPSLMHTEWLRQFSQASIPIVCVGTYSFGDVRLTHVTADHYQNARILAQTIEQRGYKKVLVILFRELEEILLHQYDSLFSRLTRDKERKVRWKMEYVSERRSPNLERTFEEFVPQLIVVPGVDQYQYLCTTLGAKALKQFLGADLGLLCHSESVEHPAFTISVDERLPAIGQAAVDQLASLIVQTKSESSLITQRVLIEGILKI